MAQKDENKNLSITKDDLKEIISAAVSAAKAPNVVEQAQLDKVAKQIEEDQKNRKLTAKGVFDEIQAKKWTQANCSHEHKNGDTHCVYVQERVGPGYLICQKNQCIIRPGQASENYKGTVIYDTALFNKIFQKLPGGEIFG